MKGQKTLAALVVLSTGLLAACGDDDKKDSAPTTADSAPATADSTPATADSAPAADVCPSKLTIRTDWYPELEHGGTYQLIGTEGTISKDQVNYSGPVQEQYAVGGLQELEIQTVNGDQSGASALLEGDVDMAYINMSDVIKDSAAVDMVAIAKTLDKDPQMVMWDPATYDIQKPEDIKATGAEVLHFPGTAYIDYMIASGIMDASQDNPDYNGSDSKFVSTKGAIIQQGFATNEVYKYENEVNWKDGAPADVSFFTVGDMGFDNYPAAITMMRDRVTELDACLKLLVPVMQQAWIDFLNDPKPIMDKMIEINQVHDGFWGLSEAQNDAGFALLESDGFATNSADGTYCSFDADRIQGLYDVLAPIYADQGVDIADSADSLFTNEYCADAPGRS